MLQTTPILRVLRSLPKYGPVKAELLLVKVRASEKREVRQLTVCQKGLLTALIDSARNGDGR